MDDGWIPEDVGPEFGHDVVTGAHLPLEKVTMRFSVGLPDDEQAAAFEYHFRPMFPRAAATRRGQRVYVVFNCAALGSEDASLQAAVAVESVCREKLVQAGAKAVQFVDAKQTGRVEAHELARFARERDAALAQAMAWGMVAKGQSQLGEAHSQLGEAQACEGQEPPRLEIPPCPPLTRALITA